MRDKNGIYYNKFFDGREPTLTFNDNPRVLSNLTERNIWEDESKFYFLPFLINCYKFTRKHKLPYFALMVSPTMMFYRDRLHLRHFMDSVHQVFFKTMEMCGLMDERIMLLVEKRFHIVNPIDGGSQQLYNMLWDVDLNPKAEKCKVLVTGDVQLNLNWNNPSMMKQDELWLSRGTLWFQDDLQFLTKRFYLDSQYCQKEDMNGRLIGREGEDEEPSNDDDNHIPLFQDCSLYGNNDRFGEFHAPEVLDLTNVQKSKKDLFKPREFYFKVFEPREVESDDDDETISSDSDLIDEIDDFDEIDSTRGMVDSTLDFEEDDEEMKKIMAFFANMPKVTGLVQGMLDMITSLTRILPLVMSRLDKPEDEKLKKALERTIGILGIGIDKILKLCRFLGIKVERKQSGAISIIVKDRFKKNKKDFIEYEIDELNKTIDSLENVDQNSEPMKPIHPCDIPPDLTPNNLYPQKMHMHRHEHLMDQEKWDKLTKDGELKIPSVIPEPPKDGKIVNNINR